MRRRQAYAQQVDDFIRAQSVSYPESDVATSGLSVFVSVEKFPEIRCKCGREFNTEHGLKIHSARCKG